MKRYDPQTGKAAGVARIGGGFPVGITFSPQRHRLGGIVARPKAGEETEPEFRLWALDLHSGKTAESGAVHLDDSSVQGGPVRWDADGNAMTANTDEDNAARAFVLDTRADKTVECNLPLFLIDR